VVSRRLLLTGPHARLRSMTCCVAAVLLLTACAATPEPPVGNAPPHDASPSEIAPPSADAPTDPGPTDADASAVAEADPARPSGPPAEEATAGGIAAPGHDGDDVAEAPVEATLQLRDRVVAIDPGHNGGNFSAPEEISRQVEAGGFSKPCNTTGTTAADGTRESTVNLAVAQRLRDRLEAAGATVHLTRDGDDGVGPCVDERGTVGQRVGADLVVSIHADGAAVGGRGFHVIHPRPGSAAAGPVDASERLAIVVRDALVAAGLRPSNYTGREGLVARDDLATLNLAEVPVVLLEAGNLRDPDDAAELLDPAWQAELAGALARAIEAFLDPAVPTTTERPAG
jgi:N-acetylmuramoyl-L-alanine amidase